MFFYDRFGPLLVHSNYSPNPTYLMHTGGTQLYVLIRLNPLTAGVAYIRVFIFISTLSTTF